MPFSTKAVPFLQTIDYGYLLPALAHLPLPAGYLLSMARGAVLFGFDYDWRNYASGENFVRSRTCLAMLDLMPRAGVFKRWIASLMRFVHHSREEWQACLYNTPKMDRIHSQCRIEGLDAVFTANRQGRGVVLVSCHVDSFCMGMVLLGMSGIRMNCVNTVRIEDNSIHPRVRTFFQHKYRAMERLMNGRMAYHETEIEYFYQALDKGQTVALMGDIPGSQSDIYINFLGHIFRLPLGAWHMAKKTNSLLGGYVCVNQGIGRYRVIGLPPCEIDPQNPERSLRPAYDFLQTWIQKMPQRWISADLLSGLPRWS